MSCHGHNMIYHYRLCRLMVFCFVLFFTKKKLFPIDHVALPAITSRQRYIPTDVPPIIRHIHSHALILQ